MISLILSTLFSDCTSQNLNVSPLCNLSNQLSETSWADDVKSIYSGSEVPEYIKSLKSGHRLLYPTQKMADQEILKSVTKVR